MRASNIYFKVLNVALKILGAISMLCGVVTLITWETMMLSPVEAAITYIGVGIIGVGTSVSNKRKATNKG